MPGRLNLDSSLSMAASIGPGLGLEMRDLRALLPKFAAVHATFVEAGDRGWPHLAALLPGACDAATAWGAARAAAAQRVLVLGEPGAVDASLALSSAAGAGAERVSVVTAPDAAVLAAALEGPAPHLLVLDGPTWVRTLSLAIQARCDGITVVPRDGEAGAGWCPEAGLLTGPGGADPRFGVLGPAAFGLLALAGVDVDAVVAEAITVARAAGNPALFENPAYRLAATLLASRERDVHRLALLLPTPRLLGWAAWCGRAWAGLTARVGRESDGVHRHGGVRASALCLGDEVGVQVLVEGAPDALTLALWAESPGLDQAIGSHLSTWEIARRLSAQHVRQLSVAGRPVVQLRLAGLDASSLAGLSVLMLQAGLAMALALDLDPMAMPAALRWRAMTDEALPLAAPNGDLL